MNLMMQQDHRPFPPKFGTPRILLRECPLPTKFGDWMHKTNP